MKQRGHSLAVLLMSVVFLFIGAQPLFAAEKMVRMVVAMECGCPGAINRLDSAAKSIPGVLECDVNGFTREVTIKFDDTKTSVERIVESLTDRYFPIEGEPQIIK
jgi:copper chaperone CopZ